MISLLGAALLPASVALAGGAADFPPNSDCKAPLKIVYRCVSRDAAELGSALGVEGQPNDPAPENLRRMPSNGQGIVTRQGGPLCDETIWRVVDKNRGRLKWNQNPKTVYDVTSNMIALKTVTDEAGRVDCKAGDLIQESGNLAKDLQAVGAIESLEPRDWDAGKQEGSFLDVRAAAQVSGFTTAMIEPLQRLVADMPSEDPNKGCRKTSGPRYRARAKASFDLYRETVKFCKNFSGLSCPISEVSVDDRPRELKSKDLKLMDGWAKGDLGLIDQGLAKAIDGTDRAVIGPYQDLLAHLESETVDSHPMCMQQVVGRIATASNPLENDNHRGLGAQKNINQMKLGNFGPDKQVQELPTSGGVNVGGTTAGLLRRQEEPLELAPNKPLTGSLQDLVTDPMTQASTPQTGDASKTFRGDALNLVGCPKKKDQGDQTGRVDAQDSGNAAAQL